jgi:hypothetical protein
MSQKLIYVERTNTGTDGDWKLELPLGARVLSVQNQRGVLALWFEFEPGQKRRTERVFKVVETGERFDASVNSVYLGTVQFDEGNYVVHVYEVTP